MVWNTRIINIRARELLDWIRYTPCIEELCDWSTGEPELDPSKIFDFNFRLITHGREEVSLDIARKLWNLADTRQARKTAQKRIHRLIQKGQLIPQKRFYKWDAWYSTSKQFVIDVNTGQEWRYNWRIHHIQLTNERKGQVNLKRFQQYNAYIAQPYEHYDYHTFNISEKEKLGGWDTRELEQILLSLGLGKQHSYATRIDWNLDLEPSTFPDFNSIPLPENPHYPQLHFYEKTNYADQREQLRLDAHYVSKGQDMPITTIFYPQYSPHFQIRE